MRLNGREEGDESVLLLAEPRERGVGGGGATGQVTVFNFAYV